MSLSRGSGFTIALGPLLLLLHPGCTTGGEFVDQDGGQSAQETGARDGSDAVHPDLFSPFDAYIGPPVRLSLATFNVQNFFDEHDDPSHADDLPTATEVADKIKKIGAALRALDADVLALQEVENRALLDRLNSEELGSLGYEHVQLFEGNDVRGIDVALLSRHPIIVAMSHVEDRFLGVDGDTTYYAFSRDCLEAIVEPSPGRKLILLVNHLRASDWKDPDTAIARRLAQAQRVREIADATLSVHPQANLAVIGDLNDIPGSQTLALIQNGSPALSDPLTQLPAAERYTTYLDSDKIQLDYILVAPGLAADLVAGSIIADHSQVFADASDHFPVKVSLELR